MMRRTALSVLLFILFTAPPAWAVVTFDAATGSLRTGTQDPYTFTHTSVSPDGIICAASHGVTSGSHILSMSYGGVALTFQIRRVDTAGEQGIAETWAAGDLTAKASNTVSIDLDSATADDIQFSCVTVQADANTEIETGGSCTNPANTNEANPQCTTGTLASAQRVALMANYYGGGSPGTCAQETATLVASADHGNFSSLHCRTVNLTDTAYTCGATQVADDEALACTVISEVAGGGGGGGGVKRLLTLGVGN